MTVREIYREPLLTRHRIYSLVLWLLLFLTLFGLGAPPLDALKVTALGLLGLAMIWFPAWGAWDVIEKIIDPKSLAEFERDGQVRASGWVFLGADTLWGIWKIISLFNARSP